MAYPDDKEEFRRVVNQDLPAEPGTVLDEQDQNLPADFLERLQDTLGYSIKMGYATVKAFFDYVASQVTLIAGKVNKTGDIMTGDLKLQGTNYESKKLYLEQTHNPDSHFIYVKSNAINLENLLPAGFNFRIQNNATLKIAYDSILPYVNLNMNDKNIINCKSISFRETGDITLSGPGSGLILKTPDGTKSFRISVDNAGNIVSTQV